MTTTGSRLEMLSAFVNLISSYLALMRELARQSRALHSFLFGNDVSLTEQNLILQQDMAALYKPPFFIAQIKDRGSSL